MRKLVPLHCLVITVGPMPSANETMLGKYFPKYDVISADAVRYDIGGDSSRRDIDGVVFSEIHRRVETKLRLGERAVVNAANLRRDGRMALASIGQKLGVPVFYLVCDNPNAETVMRQRFTSAERDILRGDGIADVIDLRVCDLDVVQKLGPNPLDQIRSRFNGITVIGDIHGMYHSLLAALDWARSRRHFALFLGDVVDYGSGTLECADEVYRTVMRGNGELIIGNHERKIARWIDQTERGRHMMRLSEGNKVTTAALNQLGASRRDHWMARFRGLVSRSPQTLTLDNYVFTHAAIHPSWWTGDRDEKNMENFSLFGEFDTSPQPFTEANRPHRTYNWVEQVPANMTVFVGHDARSTTAPITTTNDRGGKAVFMDTGSGKGGYLSSVDLRFTPEGLLRPENFSRH
jgi:predicted kinase